MPEITVSAETFEDISFGHVSCITLAENEHFLITGDRVFLVCESDSMEVVVTRMQSVENLYLLHFDRLSDLTGSSRCNQSLYTQSGWNTTPQHGTLSLTAHVPPELLEQRVNLLNIRALLVTNPEAVNFKVEYSSQVSVLQSKRGDTVNAEATIVVQPTKLPLKVCIGVVWEYERI